MILVGICGAISSGKSTFAELLTSIDPDHSVHMETSGLVVELANTFNEALQNNQTELVKIVDFVPFANVLITALLPQLSEIAQEPVTIEQVMIRPEDMSTHPDWYEKLFVYLKQAQQMPSIVSEPITADNRVIIAHCFSGSADISCLSSTTVSCGTRNCLGAQAMQAIKLASWH